MAFTLIFIHNFLLFVNTVIPKAGFYIFNSGGPVFSTIFSYSILPNSFTAVLLERCLCKRQSDEGIKEYSEIL